VNLDKIDLKRNILKKNILLTATVAVALFSGCSQKI